MKIKEQTLEDAQRKMASFTAGENFAKYFFLMILTTVFSYELDRWE